MAVIYALTTATKVKAFIGETSSTYDSLLGVLIDGATDFIESYCGNRRLVADSTGDGTAVTRTEYYNGNKFNYQNKFTIQLRGYPVILITGIYYSAGALNALTWTLFDPASQYTHDPQTGEVQFMAPLPMGMQNIKVVYTAGYKVGTTRTLPESLDLACQKLVAAEFNKRRSQGIATESVGGANISWQTEMPEDVKKVLDSFKRLSF